MLFLNSITFNKILKNKPRLKNILKFIYIVLFRIFSFFVRKDRLILVNRELSFIPNVFGETFFGYYDKSPLNSNGINLLFHESIHDTSKNIRLNSSIKIGIFNLISKQIKYIGLTKAFNWQQGSRLQWLDSNFLIYNDFNGTDYISRVFDVTHFKEVKTFNRPVQDAFKREFFLSINYYTLTKYKPDYGYFSHSVSDAFCHNDYRNEGIWHVDFYSGEDNLILSIDRLLNINFDISFNNSHHYVNHVMISPNGDKFIFLHRYIHSNVKYDRLFVSNIDGSILNIIPSGDLVSHYSWIDNENIIVFMKDVNNILGYFKINIKNLTQIRIEGDNLLTVDGHPSMYNHLIYTDTYPSKQGFQNLGCFELNGKYNLIGQFYHPIKFFGVTRCDLHPRITNDYIFVDTVFSGKRRLAWMKR